MTAFERANRAFAFLTLFLLASCAFRVEQMRIHMDNEKHGSLVFTAQTNVDSDTGEEGPDRTAARDYVEKLEQRLKSCGLGTAVFDKGGKVWFNARMVFDYPHEATSALGCTPNSWDDMDLHVSKTEGLLWDTYTTKLLFSQPVLVAVADEKNAPPSGEPGPEDNTARVEINDLGAFPRILRLTLPGKIDSTANESRILGGRIRVQNIGPSTLQVDFDHADDPSSRDQKVREDFLARHEAAVKAGKLEIDQVEKQGSDILKLSIVSHQRKYELKDILSILGVLFGSGFLLQLAGKWFSRQRPGPAPGPA